jgi:hypothetical protein
MATSQQTTADKKFAAVFRVLWEQTGGPVNNQVLNRVKAIESKARQMREEGYKPEQVYSQLRGEVADLKAEAAAAFRDTAANYRKALEDRVGDLVKQREKKPELRNMQLLETQNTIDALTADEAKQLAHSYRMEEADLSLEELNALSRKLERVGDSDSHTNLRRAMSERRAHEWWLNDEQAAGLDAEAARLEGATGGAVPVSDDGGISYVDIETLIDWGGELDAEA